MVDFRRMIPVLAVLAFLLGSAISANATPTSATQNSPPGIMAMANDNNFAPASTPIDGNSEASANSGETQFDLPAVNAVALERSIALLPRPRPLTTNELFPNVTSQLGLDTGISFFWTHPPVIDSVVYIASAKCAGMNDWKASTNDGRFSMVAFTGATTNVSNWAVPPKPNAPAVALTKRHRLVGFLD